MVAPNPDFEDLTHRVQQAIPETEKLVMTLAEKLLQEGERKGLDRGRKEGSSSHVQRLIEFKLGPLDPEALTHLDAADEAALTRFGERVLTATSVEEVFEVNFFDLKQHGLRK
jgi:hypothetical protein